MIDFYKALLPETRERVDRNRKRQQEISDMKLKDFIETVKYNYKNCGVIANKYREEDRQKAEMQNMIQYEQEIADLKEVKKAFEEEQALKKRMLEYRKSNANN